MAVVSYFEFHADSIAVLNVPRTNSETVCFRASAAQTLLYLSTENVLARLYPWLPPSATLAFPVS